MSVYCPGIFINSHQSLSKNSLTVFESMELLEALERWGRDLSEQEQGRQGSTDRAFSSCKRVYNQQTLLRQSKWRHYEESTWYEMVLEDNCLISRSDAALSLAGVAVLCLDFNYILRPWLSFRVLNSDNTWFAWGLQLLSNRSLSEWTQREDALTQPCILI